MLLLQWTAAGLSGQSGHRVVGHVTQVSSRGHVTALSRGLSMADRCVQVMPQRRSAAETDHAQVGLRCYH